MTWLVRVPELGYDMSRKELRYGNRSAKFHGCGSVQDGELALVLGVLLCLLSAFVPAVVSLTGPKFSANECTFPKLCFSAESFPCTHL